MSRPNLSPLLVAAILVTASAAGAHAQDDGTAGDVQAVNGKKVLTKPAAIATTGAVATTPASATGAAIQTSTGAQVRAEGAHDMKAGTGIVKSEGANDMTAPNGAVKAEGAHDLQGGAAAVSTTAAGH